MPSHLPEVDALYTRLIQMEVRQLAICSPARDNGTSMLAQALARRAAAAGKKVLLIDLNIENPALTRPNTSFTPGWLPLHGHWEHAVYNGTVAGLDLLSAPQESSRCMEFHDLQLLKLFFNGLKEHYELVICDLAPVCERQDSQLPAPMLAAACGACVLNILSGVTTESQLQEACEILESNEARLLGVVMNDYHTPSLKSELIRETYRLERILPKMMAKLRKRFAGALLLNQDL